VTPFAQVACARQAEPGSSRARHGADSGASAAGLGRPGLNPNVWCDRSAGGRRRLRLVLVRQQHHGDAASPCVAARAGSDCRRRRRGHRSAKNAATPMHQSREAHPLGAAAPRPRGLFTINNRRFRTWHQEVAPKATRYPLLGEGLPPEQAGPRAQAADLGFCAPGRTRTCTLRIRREARPVRLVSSWSIIPGRVRGAVRLVASRPAP
jgi:hypothetical protein